MAEVLHTCLDAKVIYQNGKAVPYIPSNHGQSIDEGLTLGCGGGGFVGEAEEVGVNKEVTYYVVVLASLED